METLEKSPVTKTAENTFPVTGITCASCVARVESMLKSQPGVEKVQVNLAGQSATIFYHPETVTPKQLQKAVQSIGYDLLIQLSEADVDALEKQREKEYTTLKQRTIGALALAIPVAVLGMLYHHPSPALKWIELLLTLPVVFGFGWPFYQRAFAQARHGSAGMDALVALSTGTAFFSARSIPFIRSFSNAGGCTRRFISRRRLLSGLRSANCLSG